MVTKQPYFSRFKTKQKHAQPGLIICNTTLHQLRLETEAYIKRGNENIFSKYRGRDEDNGRRIPD